MSSCWLCLFVCHCRDDTFTGLTNQKWAEIQRCQTSRDDVNEAQSALLHVCVQIKWVYNSELWGFCFDCRCQHIISRTIPMCEVQRTENTSKRWNNRKVLVHRYCPFYCCVKNKEQKTVLSCKHFYRLLVFCRVLLLLRWKRREIAYFTRLTQATQQLLLTKTNLRAQGGKRQRRENRGASQRSLKMWAWPDSQSYNTETTEMSFPPPLPPCHIWLMVTHSTRHLAPSSGLKAGKMIHNLNMVFVTLVALCSIQDIWPFSISVASVLTHSHKKIKITWQP